MHAVGCLSPVPHPPRASPAHIATLVRAPLRFAKGAYASPLPPLDSLCNYRHSRVRGNDVLRDGNDGAPPLSLRTFPPRAGATCLYLKTATLLNSIRSKSICAPKPGSLIACT